MANREFLMLAKTFDPDRHTIAGYFVSEKYDGQRCFWDGGISQGKLKQEIPWANTDKDERYVREQRCTGLWSRYGNVIHAPLWFVEQLPSRVMLDGELYIDRGQFQRTRSIISRLEPGPEWKDVKFLVFDTPTPQVVFGDGKINNPNFKKIISWDECKQFTDAGNWPQFAETYSWLRLHAKLPNVVEQHWLSYNETTARRELYEMLDDVTSKGGEGLMLRAPYSHWTPTRHKSLLKVKKMNTDDAIVRGYVWALDGKLRGKMGALRIEWQEKTFLISGFTDEERELYQNATPAYGLWREGDTVQDGITNPRFPIGSKVKFRYAGLTDDGYPREGRYCRGAMRSEQ